MKRIALLLLLVLTAVATWSRDNVPDFNYPKQVTQQAESDLKKALSKGDGQQVVDAIVRVSIAQSQLSREEMSKIIDLIERTVSNENAPAIRALLRHFEAVVMRSYCASFISIDRRGDDDIRIYDPNPGARQRDPYAQWTTDQFANRIDELVLASLADSAVLCSRPVTDFPRIIKCDKLGASYVPTLYQFLIKENMSLASSDVKKQLQQRWVWSTSGNQVANVWTRKRLINENYSGSYRSRALEIIAEHPDAEINGLLLEDMSDDSDYKMLCDYASRYPKSRYTPDVREFSRLPVPVGECAQCEAVRHRYLSLDRRHELTQLEGRPLQSGGDGPCGHPSCERSRHRALRHRFQRENAAIALWKICGGSPLYQRQG